METKQLDLELLVDQSIRRSQGSYELTRYWECGGHRWMTHVHRDAYTFQSRATCDVWSTSDLAWHNVITWPGEQISHMPAYTTKDEIVIREACDMIEYDLIADAISITGNKES